jgi:hypothetical protein
MKPPALHWSAIAILEAFGRQSGIGARRYLEIALQGAEPTDEEDRALREGFFPLGGLTSPHIPSTLPEMPSIVLSSNRLRSKARITEAVRAHRFVQTMEKRGLTFSEVALELARKLRRKVPLSSLLSWVKPADDDNARGIPGDAAEALRELYGVPLTAWRRVIPKA